MIEVGGYVRYVVTRTAANVSQRRYVLADEDKDTIHFYADESDLTLCLDHDADGRIYHSIPATSIRHLTVASNGRLIIVLKDDAPTLWFE